MYPHECIAFGQLRRTSLVENDIKLALIACGSGYLTEMDTTDVMQYIDQICLQFIQLVNFPSGALTQGRIPIRSTIEHTTCLPEPRQCRKYDWTQNQKCANNPTDIMTRKVWPEKHDDTKHER